MRWMVYVALAMVCAGTGVQAQEEAGGGKKRPKLVFAQGEASQTVAVDGVRLFFKFPTEKGSFVEAGKESDAVVSAIQGRLSDLGGASTMIWWLS